MAITDAHGLPIAIHSTSASPNEVTLVEDTLRQVFLSDAPQRLIGDRAYDSDGLDRKLRKKKIDMIAPNRAGRNQSQDRRPLRRYRRRWKVERFFAWLKNFRRVALRWDRKIEHYFGFAMLGCTVLLLKRI